jgi:hypothetical protein
MELETIKFILIYYKKDQNNLYAWTLEKEKMKSFLSQRCKDCFIIKKKKLDSTLSAVFMNRNYNKKLVDIPLYNGEKYVTIIGTYDEENQMQDAADNIFSQMTAIKQFLHMFPLKNKYMEVIDKLCTISKKDEESDTEYMQINLFDLFLFLHRGTFTLETDDLNEN